MYWIINLKFISILLNIFLIKLSITHCNIYFLTIDPFIWWFLSLKITSMLLIGIDTLNWSYIFRHIWSRNSLKIWIMNKITIISSMTSWSRVIINTRNSFLLKIFMNFILSQKSSFIGWLIISSDQSSLWDQRLSFSII